MVGTTHQNDTNFNNDDFTITSGAMELNDAVVKKIEIEVLADAITATGGTVTTYTDSGTKYKVHAFTSSGNFVVTNVISGDVDYFMIGGGGGGSGGTSGSWYGSGGSGGDVEEGSTTVGVSTYSVVVGAGGAGTKQAQAGNGTASSFNSISTAGGSGDDNSTRTGADSADYSGDFSTGTNGGGGAGIGADGSDKNGGDGLDTTITGSTLSKGGGGGGGTDGLGADGGGNGSGSTGSSATSNSGSGGGGGSSEDGGGAGGSGIVYIRYPIEQVVSTDVTPSAHSFAIEGSDGITTSGSGSTITVSSAAFNPDYVLISSTTASDDSTICFTDLDSDYIEYVIRIFNLVPATNDTDLYIRTSTDNGSNYDSATFDYTWKTLINRNGSNSVGNNEVDTKIVIADSLGSNTNEELDSTIRIINTSGTTYQIIMCDSSLYDADGKIANFWGGGIRGQSADVDAVQFLMSSGNISSGIFKLYGITGS